MATNRIETLDPALIRPGQFIHVLETLFTVQIILELYSYDIVTTLYCCLNS